MTYDDMLDAFRDKLSDEAYQNLLCNEALFAFVEQSKDGMVTDEAAFMRLVIDYGRRMNDFLRSTMPPAWGEDS